MPYILNTPNQIKLMLKEIGASSFDELYTHLPDEIKIKGNLNIPQGLSEHALRRSLQALAKDITSIEELNSFLGAGLYDHYIPAALKHLLYRSEFYTSYTPYQAECSQGVLQAIYEYQSYICILTGMDVTNASMYDGATALAEAILMSLRINKRNKILVAKSIHPEYRETLNTYLSGLDFKQEVLSFDKDGLLDLDYLKGRIDGDISCLALQSPNFFGLIEDLEEISSLLKEKGIMVVLVTNPLSLAIFKEPAELGADIVCGDGQVLGGSLNFGGPTFGFLATKKEYLRQLPGRIVGRTTDVQGRPAYCLTLQTREQHIRREKATSNICSNESLNTIGAAIYLSLLGRDGFKNVALWSLNLAHYLYEQLKEIKGIRLPFSNRFFNEFVWQIDKAEKVSKKLMKKRILAGLLIGKFYPEMKNSILSACTEKKRPIDIDQFIASLKEVLGV